MSNKEAIEALKRIRDEAIENFIGEWSDYEAFDIAIKALKGADRKRGRVMTNLEWIRTLSEEEFADWLYDEWLHHLQYRWSSSRGGLIIWLKDRKTEPTSSKMEQVDKDINVRSKDKPQICDTCRYYNSNIPCGSTPSACKEADKFAEEFVDGLKKLKPKDEPQTEREGE